MISREDEPLLDAPIPGQSLTAELGGRPWQKPSEMNTLEDAIDYYMAGIKYTLDTEDGYKDKDITEVDSVKAEKELLQEDVDSLVNEVTDNDNVEEEPVAIENQTEDEPKGLMARRTM